MKNICLYFFILLISFSFNSCKKKITPIVFTTNKVDNLINKYDSSLVSEIQDNSKHTYHKYFVKTDFFLLREKEKVIDDCKPCINNKIKPKLVERLDSFTKISYTKNIVAPSACRSLDIQLDTQLDSIKKIQKIANISRKEEGYREARDLKKDLPSVFFYPKAQEKSKISFRINLGTVGFLHSHTLNNQTRGFYSLADVKVFLYLLDITYKGLNEEQIKTYTMYDLYSTLIYGNQIYTMRIEDLADYKKFYHNENNLKVKVIKKLNEMYKNPNVHFNFFKNDFISDPDENLEALNYLSINILSKIGIKIYILKDYDRRNKDPKWKMLYPSKVGNGFIVNPC